MKTFSTDFIQVLGYIADFEKQGKKEIYYPVTLMPSEIIALASIGCMTKQIINCGIPTLSITWE